MKTAALTLLAAALLPSVLPFALRQEPAEKSAPAAGPVRSGPPQARLLVLVRDPATKFAMALEEARAGRMTAAAKAIDDALAAPGADSAPGARADDTLRARAEREKTRIAAWCKLRDAYLTAIAGTKEKLAVVHEGKALKLDVDRVAAGHVFFAANKAGLESLPLDSFPVGPLAQQMGKKGAELGPAWARAWALTLAGDAKAKSLLKGEDADSAALRADAERDYPERLATLDAVLELNALAAVPTTSVPAEARATLERVLAFKKARGAHPLAVERAEALRAYAAALYGALFEETGPATALHCKWEDKGQGKVRVLYPFDEPEELADFETPDYMSARRAQYPKLQGGHDDRFAVKKGTLNGVGAACVRLPIAFGPEIVLRCDVTFSKPSGSAAERYVMAAIGDDGHQNFAWLMNAGHLEVWAGGGSKRTLLDQDPGMDVDVTYRMEIRADGKIVSAWRDGEKVLEMPFERDKGGMPFLWIHSDCPVAIGKLEIEGTVDPSSFAHMRDAWVEAQLASF